MEIWFLVIVLGLPAEQNVIEQHVAVRMPDQPTCEVLRSAFVYAVNITSKYAQNTPDDFVDPFLEFDEPVDDVRTPLEVHEMRCEVSDE